MLVLLLLIVLILSGAIAVDVFTTVAGGALSGIIFLVILLVRKSRK